MKRHDRMQRVKSGGRNSLASWTSVRSPARVLVNWLVTKFCKRLPSLRAKRWLLRKLGARIGKNVGFSESADIDFFFPDLIEVGDNTVIGFQTLILTHEFLVGEFRKAPVKIGKNVLVGARCIILPGVEIGDGATVSAMSLVNKDVPAGETWGGIPARKIRMPPIPRNQNTKSIIYDV
ncbi:acyltransferase [Candidatus Micrarchaeota archaeon]|nr:acyltransferase [Candidatus Micrarchaeota archaeon]